MGDGNRRLTIVDRYELCAGALQHALSTRAFECRRVITLEMTARRVVRAIGRSRPDLVVVSMDLSGVDVVEVLTSLSDGGLPVVALVVDDDHGRMGEAFAAGADAVAAKSWAIDRLIQVIDATMGGHASIAAPVRERLVRAYETELGPYRARLARLSPQELDLLAHMMEGRGAVEVARIRTVSESTVRTQARALMAKLEVSSQLTAVAVARRAGYSPTARLVDQRTPR